MNLSIKPEVLEEIRCRVCNNSNPEKFTLVYDKEKFAVFSCNDCGLYFIPPYYRKKIDYGNYKDEKVTEAVRAGNNWVKIQRHKLRLKFIQKYEQKKRDQF